MMIKRILAMPTYWHYWVAELLMVTGLVVYNVMHTYQIGIPYAWLIAWCLGVLQARLAKDIINEWREEKAFQDISARLEEVHRQVDEMIADIESKTKKESDD